MRFSFLLLCIAVTVFLASTFGVMYALEAEARWAAWVAFFGMAVAAVLFLLSAIAPWRRIDWKRIQTEQRLWESGPLGRAWLKLRRRLSSLWKL